MQNPTAKLFLFTLLSALNISSYAQTTVTAIIKGAVKIDSVSMDDISTREHYSLPYRDTLTFKFKKKDVDWYNIKYYINNKRYKSQLWLDPGKITVEAHLIDTAHLQIDTVLNSPIYYEHLAMLNTPAAMRADTTAHNAMLMAGIQKYLETPRSVYLTGSYVNYNQNSRANLLKLKEVLSHRRTDLSWFIMYEGATERLNKLLEVKKFNLADFTFINRMGKTGAITLDGSDYYLLDFWYLACPPCRRDHMWISENIARISAQKIKVISISTDEKKYLPEWNEYLNQRRYNWDNYLQTGNKTLTRHLGISGYPTYILLNSKGEIVKTANDVVSAIQPLK